MPAPFKHSCSPWLYGLVGITADCWWRLLRENRFAVYPAFYHRLIFQALFGMGVCDVNA